MGQTKLLFQRYEKKYLLSEKQYEQVIKALQDKMVPDEHANYSIKNIYFDTADYGLIRASIDGKNYKEKLRLRAYGTWNRKDNDKVFLEIKKKYDGIVYKRRIGMSYSDAMFYIFGGIRPEHLSAQQTAEFDFFLKRHPIAKRTFLTYDRVAYAAADGGDLRITFDRNIRYQTGDFSFDEVQASEILPTMGTLMEIKNPLAMPLWVSRMLSENKIRPYSFSKIGEVYRNTMNDCSEGERICSIQ